MPLLITATQAIPAKRHGSVLLDAILQSSRNAGGFSSGERRLADVANSLLLTPVELPEDDQPDNFLSDF